MVRIALESHSQDKYGRFELVVLGAYRAEEIARGSQVKIPTHHNKSCVLALREISEHTQDLGRLQQLYVKGLQSNTAAEDYASDATEEMSLSEAEEALLSESEEDMEDSGEVLENDFISIEEDDAEPDDDTNI